MEKSPKLRAFKNVQKNFAVAGINPTLITQSYPLNGKIFMRFLVFGASIIFLSVYFSNYVETFSEYTQSVYMDSAMVLSILVLLILTLRVGKLFKYINCCDTMLNASRWNIRLKILGTTSSPSNFANIFRSFEIWIQIRSRLLRITTTKNIKWIELWAYDEDVKTWCNWFFILQSKTLADWPWWKDWRNKKGPQLRKKRGSRIYCLCKNYINSTRWKKSTILSIHWKNCCFLKQSCTQFKCSAIF